MTNETCFNFFISNKRNRVQKDDLLWEKSVPGSRCPSHTDLQTDSPEHVTYGKYFNAARSFLKKERFKTIVFAASQYCKTEIKPENIKQIDIFLEKHGAFYHPSRIEIDINCQQVRFVLNVATSRPGKSCIKKEYKTLQRLNHNFSKVFFPVVYEFGEVNDKDNNDSIPMFLGEWLEGYNEFHISKDVNCNKNRICVWSPENGNFFLSNQEETELYSQASMILTYYFNLETFEQIFPWHHAAGDFVVSKNNGKIKTKLITARQYASMIQNTGDCKNNINFDPDFILEALLLFFLNLSIRMRIDRMDGTGNIVWSEKTAVKGMVKGFNKALILKSFPGNPATRVDVCFKDYILSFSQEKIFSLIQEIVNTYNPLSKDVDLIRQNLEEHVETLYSKISKAD